MAIVRKPNTSLQIISERQRILQQLPFAASSTISRDLPRDTVLKYLVLTLSGSIQTTFASGTPVADVDGVFDNLVSEINVVIGGSRVVKNIRPAMLNFQQLLATKIPNVKKSSAAAAALNVGQAPTADAAFVYGTTTQYTTVRESLLLPFENILAVSGRESTWLNLKGVASAEIRFSTKAFSSLLGYGNTAPVTYGNSTLAIDIQTIEAQDVDAGVYFSDFKQTQRKIPLSASMSGYLIDINRGNYLQGIMLFAKDGAAGTATTATGNLASDSMIQNVGLKLNGNIDVKVTTFNQLQDENRSKFGIYAPQASNTSKLQGFAYLDLLRNGDLNTALDVRPPAVDNVQLFISTSSFDSYATANLASATIVTNEIVMP